jgi:hypothetical protein
MPTLTLKPMKVKFLIALFLIAHVSDGQNLFTKTVAKLAKGMGKAVNVETSAALNEMTPTVAIDCNLHSNKVGTISQTFFDGWVPGGEMSFLMLTGKKGPGFVKVDGTVTIDGKPVEYLTAGLYSQTTAATLAPRKFEIVTSSGQKSAFTIEPFAIAPFRVRSVNGQADNASVDLTKDVVIELEDVKLPDNAVLKVSIAVNQVSIKSLYEVAFIRAGSKITIPAQAFRNINIKPAGNAVYNYKKSYLSVNYEESADAKEVSGVFPSVEYIKSYNDGKFINVTTEPELNPGLTVKGQERGYNYQAFKANAFLSRPSSHLKKAGLLSFSIRGTTYKEVSQSATTTPVRMNPFGGASSTTSVTTITITKELPWEKVLEEMYPEFMAALESEFGATTVPVEKVTGSEAYKVIEESAQDDETTNVEFARNFRNTKVISAFMPLSEGYGSNSVYQKVMNETGTDALLTLTMDLQLAEGDAGKMLMIPKLAYEIAGKANGRVASTKFISATIESSTSSTFEKNLTAEQLSALIRKSDLVAAFKKSLQSMKVYEQANGDYDVVWNLRN